jgi:hypothetical protein
MSITSRNVGFGAMKSDISRPDPGGVTPAVIPADFNG